jgi:hypothetical protein
MEMPEKERKVIIMVPADGFVRAPEVEIVEVADTGDFYQITIYRRYDSDPEFVLDYF